MKALAKLLLFTVALAGMGTAGYFLLRKSNTQLKKEIPNLLPSDNLADKQRLQNILNQMTRQELLDMHRFLSMRITESNAEKMKAKIDPALRLRLIAISNKYQIFT